MTEQVEMLFSPCITLYWRGRFGKSPSRWFPDRLEGRELLRQFMQEAGIPAHISLGSGVETNQLDAVTAAAGKHGYCVETIGEPEE